MIIQEIVQFHPCLHQIDNVFLINTRKVAEGPVSEAFTADTLQAAYGGRLATAQVDQLGVAPVMGGAY